MDKGEQERSGRGKIKKELLTGVGKKTSLGYYCVYLRQSCRAASSTYRIPRSSPDPLPIFVRAGGEIDLRRVSAGEVVASLSVCVVSKQRTN